MAGNRLVNVHWMRRMQGDERARRKSKTKKNEIDLKRINAKINGKKELQRNCSEGPQTPSP